MDELSRSLLNVFTNSDINRMVHYRKDDRKLDFLSQHNYAQYVLFFQNRFLLSNQSELSPFMFNANQLYEIQSSVRHSIFLGQRQQRYLFASELTDGSAVERVLDASATFAGLRAKGEQLKAQDAALLSYAKAMFHWHQAHEFCGSCGSRTHSSQGGHCRLCTNSECEITHFPRTDPAIIVAVVNEGKCLFGRQSKWPPHRFSVIAGFVEPGESIEQAVVREVHEETNIDLDRVNYHSSQPWPFPGSIMLGFIATASNSNIFLNDSELKEARWCSVEDVIEGMASGNFRLPPKLSIAYRLIEDWFNTYCEEKLMDVENKVAVNQPW